jgi:hypothetical protein
MVGSCSKNDARAPGRTLIGSNRSSLEKYNVLIIAMPMVENEVI